MNDRVNSEIEQRAELLARNILSGRIDLALLAEKMGWLKSQETKGDSNGNEQL